MPSCFVAMPITTPPELIETYGKDPLHFTHVLSHLFKPAIEKAGYELIPPSAKGADIIHAEIIKHLETADLVLVDMSILNANVFFELGVRTALDKPVCLVKDTHLVRVPFDLTLVNYHEYDASLNAWVLEAEIEKLSSHLTASTERSDGRNSLWKYFGLTMRGTAATSESPTDEKLTLILEQLAFLTNASRRRQVAPSVMDAEGISRSVDDILRTHGGLGVVRKIEIDPDNRRITIVASQALPHETAEELRRFALIAEYHLIEIT